jgi:hypothetical protein
MSGGYENADKIQSIITDDLFPNVQHVSDVKQVLEFMENVAQPISEDQLRAVILLERLGENKRLHSDKNPYKTVIDKIMKEYKKAVAPTGVYLDTMEQLIPKPPKPIIMAERIEPNKKK